MTAEETPVVDQPADEEVADGSSRDVRAIARRLRKPFVSFLTLAWVPLTASLLSLALSVAAILVSTQQPEVLLVLPDQVRIAQGRDSGSAFVYFQPAFVSTGKNDRVEVIRDMSMVVTPPNGVEAAFTWTEQIRLVSTPSSNGLSYEHVADAVPLLVSARSASAPLCLFDAPDGFFFVPGTYRFTLLADRVVVGQSLSGDFSVAISPDQIAFLDEPGTNRFVALPIAQ